MALSLDAIEWLQERAISVATVQPGSGLADLLPLKAVIGGARIVALGEATHGTHEFYTMRHRIIELLVAEMGFTLLALEAPWPAARRIDEYVRSGTGDPATLLRGLRYWIWSTREMLDLFEWIRAQNEGRADANRIRVAGFDMQSPQMAMDDVVAYVGGIDPVAGAASAARYETFRPYARALAESTIRWSLRRKSSHMRCTARDRYYRRKNASPPTRPPCASVTWQKTSHGFWMRSVPTRGPCSGRITCMLVWRRSA